MAILLLLAACQAHPLPRQDQSPRVALTADTVLAEVYSGLDEPQRSVIRDPAEWRSFWSRAMNGRTPTPEPPAIDFERAMVIAAAVGRRPSGGYSVSIDRVYRVEGTIVVAVTEIVPGSGCILTQALTAPVTALTIPRSELPVRFSEERRVTDCG